MERSGDNLLPIDVYNQLNQRQTELLARLQAQVSRIERLGIQMQMSNLVERMQPSQSQPQFQQQPQVQPPAFQQPQPNMAPPTFPQPQPPMGLPHHTPHQFTPPQFPKPMHGPHFNR